MAKIKKRSGAHSKNKGSSFERKICKKLSMWWAGRDDIFWRTAGSGGRATQRAKHKCGTVNSAGDICALDPEGQPFIDCFLLELKKGYTHGKERIDLLKMLDAPNSKKSILLLSWWIKARKEQRFSKRKEVWIIFERDRGKTIIMMGCSFFKVMEEKAGLEYPHARIISGVDGDKFAFVVMDEFLEWWSPQAVLTGVGMRGHRLARGNP